MVTFSGPAIAAIDADGAATTRAPIITRRKPNLGASDWNVCCSVIFLTSPSFEVAPPYKLN